MYVLLKNKDQPTPIKKCRSLSSLIVLLYVKNKTSIMQATLENGQQILYIINFVKSFECIYCHFFVYTVKSSPIVASFGLL
jgi:hypothetical protein